MDEFNGLKKTMVAARTKVNLRCAVTLMLGVVDEYGSLKKGEVSVGNGLIQGFGEFFVLSKEKVSLYFRLRLSLIWRLLTISITFMFPCQSPLKHES